MPKKMSYLMLYGGGANGPNMIGIPSDANNEYDYVSKLTKVPGINVRDIQCIAPGWQHSVLVMNNGDIFAAGKGCALHGAENSNVYRVFTKDTVCEEEVTWAAAGDDYTLYQTKSGRAILYHRNESEKIEVQLQNRALCVFGGKVFGGVIDEDGCAYFIGMCDPRRVPTPVHFDSPAVELVCCTGFKAVLLSDHRVFGNGKLNNNSDSFTHVSSLAGHKIIKISGHSYACLALSDDGLVFAYGSNYFGQLGNGSTTCNYERFQQVSIPGDAKIKDIACSTHSLILSIEGELFGCGYNKYNQLFHDSSDKYVKKMTKIEIEPKLSNVFVGYFTSFAVSGIKLPENPVKPIFWKPIHILHSEMNQLSQNISKLGEQSNGIKSELKATNEELKQKIEQLSRENSQLRSQLSDIDRSITQSNEVNQRKIDQRSEELLHELHRENEELKAKIELKDLKIDLLESHVNTANDRIVELKIQINQLKDELANKVEQIENQVARENESIVDKLEQKHNDLIDHLKQEREESKNQIEMLQQKMSSVIVCIAEQALSITNK